MAHSATKATDLQCVTRHPKQETGCCFVFQFWFSPPYIFKSKSNERRSESKAPLPDFTLDEYEPVIPAPFRRPHSLPRKERTCSVTIESVEPRTKATQRGDRIGQVRKVSCLPSFPTLAGTEPICRQPVHASGLWS